MDVQSQLLANKRELPFERCLMNAVFFNNYLIERLMISPRSEACNFSPAICHGGSGIFADLLAFVSSFTDWYYVSNRSPNKQSYSSTSRIVTFFFGATLTRQLAGRNIWS
jgi:hypothetical protein